MVGHQAGGAAAAAAREPTIHDGLAVYRSGCGAPVLVVPYPHASTVAPMALDPLASLVRGLGRSVITFDPPGAYRSSRPMRGDMAEMLECAREALAVAGAGEPVDVVGHSMAALCALGLAVERPAVVRRLVLIGGCSGFPAVRRWSIPHNWRPWRDRQFWLSMWWGARLMAGVGSLADYRRLDNMVGEASVMDPALAHRWPIRPGDARMPPPPRARWLRTVRSVDYAGRLGEVRTATLVLVGRHDPQTPPACAVELAQGIADARLVRYDRSGHAPHLEQRDDVAERIGAFLAGAAGH